MDRKCLGRWGGVEIETQEKEVDHLSCCLSFMPYLMLTHFLQRRILKSQCVGFRVIYWQKWNRIFIIMFSFVYNQLKLRIVFVHLE